MMTHTDLSIVVPCYNEEGNIDKICLEIGHELEQTELNFEIIFVDDGSTDATLDKLIQLSGKYENRRIRYISFSRNFGHQKALKAGLDKSSGDAVIVMDADMQHPPVLLPLLIERWREGYEVVNTIRMDDNSPGLFKKASSSLFYKIIHAISDTPIQPGAADFRLLDRKVVDVLKSCDEEYLFLRGMTAWCGFRQCEIAYQSQRRFAGKTKYSLHKMFSLALCGITSFSIKPLRLSIFLAGIFILLSFAEIIYVLHIAIFSHDSVPGWASLAILISLLGAAILFILGIIGEYLGKLFMECKNRPGYIIKNES